MSAPEAKVLSRTAGVVDWTVGKPGGGKFTVDLSAGVGDELTVQWLNPRT